jgi:hypothetical protein
VSVRLVAGWLTVLRGALTRRPLRTWIDLTRERGLIPVLCDWRYHYAVDADGRPVRGQSDDWHDLEEVADPRMRHLVLAQAAIRHPELERLRPVRQPGDPDCGRCEGAGTVEWSAQICYCGGTGWLPAEVEPWRGWPSDSTGE